MSLEFEATGTRDQYACGERVDAYILCNDGLHDRRVIIASVEEQVCLSLSLSLSLSLLAGEAESISPWQWTTWLP
jgi:hypothetical protein